MRSSEDRERCERPAEASEGVFAERTRSHGHERGRWERLTCTSGRCAGVPSTDRRTVLAAVGTAVGGGLAGCSTFSGGDAPAGSLRLDNRDDLPHLIGVRVTGVGERPGDDGSTAGDVAVPPSQRELTASDTLSPGETETFPGVFTEPVWYAVEFAVDGEHPADGAGRTLYHPSPPDRDRGRVLGGTVYETGEFSWVVSATSDPGAFASG